MSIISKIFGDANEKYIQKARLLVEEINKLEPEFKSFSDKRLKEKTKEFKERLQNEETLDDVLVEAFANAREASRRNLNQSPRSLRVI